VCVSGNVSKCGTVQTVNAGYSSDDNYKNCWFCLINTTIDYYLLQPSVHSFIKSLLKKVTDQLLIVTLHVT